VTRPTTARLWQRIIAAPRQDFLIQPACRYGYGDLASAVQQWLGVFDAFGVGAGDRIILQTRSEAAAISGVIAALVDGVVPVLLATDTPPARTRAVTASVAPAIVIVDEGYEPPAGVRPLILPTSSPVRRSLFGRRPPPAMLPDLPFAPARRAPRLPLDEQGLAYILFTSGTTAAPSGVAISRGNLFANLATLSRLFDYDETSRIFNDMVLAHADGLIQGPLLAVANGCTVVRSGGFQLARMEDWLGRVRSTRSTHVITVPTIWSMIDQYAGHDDYFDAPECRALMSVAAKLSEALWMRLETRFKRSVFNQYGLTETVTSALYAGPHPEMGAFGTLGKPVDCEARIEPVGADDAEGELQLRGDNIFAGYWQDAERSGASFAADGWLKTGDLARRRNDGSFAIIGRLKTVIMCGGFLIRPDEIDEAMLLNPLVVESATVGLADPMFDEVPVTAVVCRGEIDEAALADHARRHLEAQKVPKRIVAVAAIPRGDAGKPNLAALRALLDEHPSGCSGPAASSSDVERSVLAAAADVFRVDPALLSLRTTQGGVKGWDSFSQLALLLAVEQRLDIRIPASRVAVIETLGDVVRVAKDLGR